jgi:type I restriction enzyme R subunit
LAAAPMDGIKIFTMTLQKFLFVLRGLLHAAGAEKRDEGHSGQTP